MALEDYVPKDNQYRALEKVARAVAEDVLLPAGKKLVADTETPWDDGAMAAFEPFLLAIIDSISEYKPPA